ncbi:MAG: DUF2064 domain-containing protein [Rhodococcus sp. (in: high G+C Gram-positive bacteria)]
MIDATLLVVAKAPVPGLAKTRLMASFSAEQAASVAASALLDTLAAAARAPFTRRVVAMTGDLAQAAESDDIVGALQDFEVIEQRGDSFSERLVHAHHDAAGSGAVVQIGMDTPQVTASMLADVGRALTVSATVLGPAEDGGWWVLGLRNAADAGAVADVEMSTSRTGADTRAALLGRGLDVGTAPMLRDVDEPTDLATVAAACTQSSRFRRMVQSLVC